MNNEKVAKTFEVMAVLLQLDEQNPFRVRAYQRASEAIAALPTPVSEMPREQLLEVPGIGKGIADHIDELSRTGKLEELDGLFKKYPPGVLDMTQVGGVGPKRAKILFEQLKIDSLEKLKAACSAGKIRKLPRFGEKLEQSILKNLTFAQEASKRMMWWDAKQLIGELIGKLGLPEGRVVPAGSFRRKRDTVGDLDLLCVASNGAEMIERFTKLPFVERVLAAGPTKASVWTKSQIQCDFRVVPEESFGAAILYFTGSKDHNVALRELALKKGMTVNEYGIFKTSDKKHAKPLAGKTEEEMYAKLGLEWIPPELRENHGEIQAAASGTLPKLVELSDVKGDFHNHSNYTDGTHTLEEMARAAERMGWEWVALGDHSQSLRVANGLSVPDLRKTIAEVRRLGEKFKGLKLMRSMEVDILKDGSLDYPDDALDEIDVVIGSVHSHFNLPEEEMTRRIVKAVRHKGFDILGHLSGRLINRREAYKVDAEAVLAAAADAGKSVEINGQPQRSDITDVQARRAKELGAGLALDTDAHSAEQFKFMECAVNIARRAALTKHDLLNCLPYKELRERLDRRGAAKRGKAAHT
jgi:DNA polymerase (family 10)